MNNQFIITQFFSFNKREYLSDGAGVSDRLYRDAVGRCRDAKSRYPNG